MTKFVIAAGLMFLFLYSIDLFTTETPAVTPAPQYSTQDLINAVNSATDQNGMVTAPAIINNLNSKPQASNPTRSLDDLVKAVIACEKEGNLTAENFSEKYSKN